MAKRYQVSDGKLLLTLQPDSDGWFVVTSPIDPAMITQARTIEEAFTQARDAFAALADSREPESHRKLVATPSQGACQFDSDVNSSENATSASRPSNTSSFASVATSLRAMQGNGWNSVSDIDAAVREMRD